MQVTLNESWLIFASITTRAARILRLTAINIPSEISSEAHRADLSDFRWEPHYRDLFQLPLAA